MAAVPGITDAGLFSSDFLITCVDFSQFMAARSHDRRTLCFANVYLFVYFFWKRHLEDASMHFCQIFKGRLRYVMV